MSFGGRELRPDWPVCMAICNCSVYSDDGVQSVRLRCSVVGSVFSNYITEHHNILLLGATGCGKTYLACALGMAAVRNFYTVKYIRLPELLTELAIARNNGTYRKVIQQYKKPSLLILDEWLLYSLKDTETRDLLEIAEARYKKASTIFCSQFDVPGWMEKIGDPLIADAICDRCVHNAYRIVIECKESMQKRKGLPESDT